MLLLLLPAITAEWQRTELAEAAPSGPLLAARSVLMVLRLQQDELGFRPLPQVSPLSQLTAAEVCAAPGTSQSGAFGTFTLAVRGWARR